MENNETKKEFTTMPLTYELLKRWFEENQKKKQQMKNKWDSIL
jgi:hypothetical protein